MRTHFCRQLFPAVKNVPPLAAVFSKGNKNVAKKERAGIFTPLNSVNVAFGQNKKHSERACGTFSRHLEKKNSRVTLLHC